MMTTAQIDITQLTPGTVKGSDVYPAVDVTDMTQATTGTTKQYEIADLLDFIINALGIYTYAACEGGSTVNLTATYDNGVLGVGATLTNSGAQAPFILDGETGIVGNRYLIKNQSNGAQNGIYTLTTTGTASSNWVLTRAIDFNSSANIIDNGNVYVLLGNTNANTFWTVTFTGPVTVGTTILTWSPFSIVPTTGFTWNVVSGTSQQMIANNGYITSNISLTTFTLPTSAAVGSSIKVVGYGSGGWQIAQNTGQTLHIGHVSTTTGTLGYLASTNSGNCVELICVAANTDFVLPDFVGNITVN